MSYVVMLVTAATLQEARRVYNALLLGVIDWVTLMAPDGAVIATHRHAEEDLAPAAATT